ncbi:MAG: cupin domain-containing protein [Thermomicrobiales bacterium]|nr:cupin domain-containing protein [Thermomicrobiales bacterium]
MPKHTELFQTKPLPAEVDALAPDTSEIRVLLATQTGSMAHGTLPPGGVSLAVRHQTVEEIWYILGGEADIWRRQGDREEVIRARAGTSLTIPLGVEFQFRTVGEEPFRFVMVTMPPWPGNDECVLVEGFWR